MNGKVAVITPGMAYVVMVAIEVACWVAVVGAALKVSIVIFTIIVPLVGVHSETQTITNRNISFPAPTSCWCAQTSYNGSNLNATFIWSPTWNAAWMYCDNGRFRWCHRQGEGRGPRSWGRGRGRLYVYGLDLSFNLGLSFYLRLAHV